jgi:hypothetical protein
LPHKSSNFTNKLNIQISKPHSKRHCSQSKVKVKVEAKAKVEVEVEVEVKVN